MISFLKVVLNQDLVNYGKIVCINESNCTPLELFDFVLECSSEPPEYRVACLLGQPPLVQVHLSRVTLYLHKKKLTKFRWDGPHAILCIRMDTKYQ